MKVDFGFIVTFLLSANMPSSCCVVGCSARHVAGCGVHFYRFPANADRCRRWILAVGRKNLDGGEWAPGPGDRVCSAHFVSGQKNDDPCHPDYVPSVQMSPSSRTEPAARDEEPRPASTSTESSMALPPRSDKHRAALDRHARRSMRLERSAELDLKRRTEKEKVEKQAALAAVEHSYSARALSKFMHQSSIYLFSVFEQCQ